MEVDAFFFFFVILEINVRFPPRKTMSLKNPDC